ncbi:MAG TPA: hypothetical protein VFE37_25640 [Chloroflexota bacterium]|nr:hypothetical protein [Chloroflexota bacterium]
MRAVRTGVLLAALLALLAIAVGQPVAAMRGAQLPPAPPTTWEGVLGATAELRGHLPRAEVPRTLLTREQLQARVIEQLNRDPAPQRLAASAKLFTALGLLDRGADLRGLVLQFRGNLVLGQYDPETKQLYVVAGASSLGPLERVTAAHEYTHALQDQYFDLQRLRPRNAPDADRSLAMASLVEADASYVGERYANVVLTPAEREERRRQVRELYREVDLDRIPLVVREQSYFPYTEGVRFLRRVLGEEAMRGEGEGYGPAVDRLFADPPQSTAQILHPERYLRRQAPVPITLDDRTAALGDGWRETRRGVLGELDHRLLLQQYVEAAVAARAAEGWAGGSYALYESDRGELAVLVRTRWDDAAEAAEWQDAYALAAQKRYGDALAAEPAPAGQRRWRTPDGALLLGGDAAETVLAMAPTIARAARLAAAPGDPPLGLLPGVGGPVLRHAAPPSPAAPLP